MYKLEASILKKELNKYKYLLYKANNKFIRNPNKDRIRFIKTRLNHIELELKAIAKHGS